MSGYLQRLVDTAAGRGDAVHPRTGSIFSPRLEERHAPLQGWEETEHVTPAEPPPPPHGTPLGLAPPEPPRGVRPTSDHAPLLPRSAAPDRRAATDAPPFGPAVSDPAISPEDPFDDRSSGRVAAPDRPALTTDAGVPATVPPPVSGRAGDPFRPVMTPAGRPDALVSAAAPGDRPRPRHGAHDAPPPDDIQIHIGRIEVLAVPPPAPRAPRAPD